MASSFLSRYRCHLAHSLVSLCINIHKITVSSMGHLSINWFVFQGRLFFPGFSLSSKKRQVDHQSPQPISQSWSTASVVDMRGAEWPGRCLWTWLHLWPPEHLVGACPPTSWTEAMISAPPFNTCPRYELFHRFLPQGTCQHCSGDSENISDAVPPRFPSLALQSPSHGSSGLRFT